MSNCMSIRIRNLLQARVIPKDDAILEIYHLDSHRLAYHLDVDNKLVPLIQRALKRVRKPETHPSSRGHETLSVVNAAVA